MSEYVTDTHAFYWHLTGDPRLSSAASKVLAEADDGEHRIWVPSITLADIPDRIIVATALHLGLPLISRDEAIQRAAVVPIVW